MKNNYLRLSMRLKSLTIAFFLFFMTAYTGAIAQKMEIDGKVRLKLTEEMAAAFESMAQQKTPNGYLRTGYSDMDQLHSQFEATSYKRVFPHAGKYEAKHRAHGLHLWYEITVSEGLNTKTVSDAYGKITSVKIAEPIYDKTLSINLNEDAPLKTNTLEEEPDDPQFSGQWHYNNTGQTGGTAGADISLLPAWGLETGSSDVIIAVTDGGIDIDHVDIAANMWVNEDEIPGNGIDDDNNGYIDDINGYGFGDNSPTIPASLHGTHVGGTVAATTNNAVGLAGVAGGSGIGDGARLMSCASFGAIGTGNFEQTYIYAADNGAVISQNSWGYTAPGNFEQVVLDAIDYFIAEAGYDENGNPSGPMQGGIVIFAAGNSGTDNDWYPAIYEPVFAVAGTDHNDNQYTNSSRGAWVELAAPAVNVLSTAPNNQYGTLTGTSMACPHTSGVAALIISKFAGDITPQQVWDRLVQTTDALDGLPDFGSGRLNAFAALQENDGVAPDAIADLDVLEIFQNAISLSWTAPADPGNGSASEYDLRYSTSPIDAENFDAATPVEDNLPASLAGSTESYTVSGLNSSSTYYFAIKSADFFGNLSSISNTAEGTTENAPVIVVTPDSLDLAIDVEIDPVATETITISNNGNGADLNYQASVDLVGLSSSKLLFPGDRLDQIDLSLYGKGNNPDAEEKLADMEVEAVTNNMKSLTNINAFDSIYYDSGDESAEDFGGLAAGTAYASAVRFEVDRPTFKLTHVRNFFRTESVTDPITIMEVYRGGDIATAELLLSQEVTEASVEGGFFEIPLEIPQTFVEGEVFWVVNKYQEGILLPQGVDQNITQRPNTFFFSGDAGVTFNPSIFIFKVRAISGSEPISTDWVSFEPSTGSIAPGESEDVTITFDASDVPNGTYSLNVVLENNDPNAPMETIPTLVEVSGQTPEIGVSHPLLEFGSVLLGDDVTLPLTITNNGLGVLDISDISSTFFSFSSDVTSATLDSGEELVVNVTFAPTFAGNINGALKVISNDPGQPSMDVLLVGVGTSPPIMVVNPTSVSSTLDAGQTGTETITISNYGNYPLTYAFPDIAARVLLNDPNIQQNDVSRIEFAQPMSEEKGVEQNLVGHPVLLGAGSDSEFGYTWIDSNEPGGPVFSWNDISETGIEINAGSDDGFTEIELPFSFEFYGEDKDAIKISSNGYLTFGVDGTDFTNDQIPSGLLPNDYIAVFWDDLRPSIRRGNVYYAIEPEKLIVQYDNVGNYAGAGVATFQVVLMSNGNITFYYNSMNELVNSASATIGIENADASDGAQIAFNSGYVEDGLAVLVMPPQPEFISNASSLSGVVGIGQSVDVEVTLDTNELIDGVYSEDLVISSNDPANAVATVPFELTVVGQPEITVIPDTLSYDSLFIGLNKTLGVTILNSGTKDLVIGSITNENAEFTFPPVDGPVQIAPSGSMTINVTYTPATAGFVSDNITISSDAVNSANYTVLTTGIGVSPPVINVSPDSLSATALGGEQAYDSLLIENTGEYPLNYTIAAPYWLNTDASRLNANQVIDFGKDLEKGEEDTRVGRPVLFGGGNDNNFGYVWEDNKDGGGPEYAFADISRDGINITSDLLSGAFADGDVEVPIGFSFPFYGNSYSNVRVSANGILMFQATAGSTFVNDPIPVDDNVNNLIAAFWDDLEPGVVSGTVHYMPFPEHFVVQFTDVGAFSSTATGSVTFQVILYPDGKIELLYEDVESASFGASGTIGIENAEGDDGMEIVFNNNYIVDGLAITIEGPATGSVAPGESALVPVTFDATGLNDGVYNGMVNITSNDPITPSVEVPATFTVIGTPEILIVPDSLDFGEVFVAADSSFSATKSVEISNVGRKVLNIDSMYVSGSAFTISSNGPISLEPQASTSLDITFSPDSVGYIMGDLLVYSDDETDMISSVQLSGSAIAPPVFTVETEGDTIYARVQNQGAANRVITIGNLEGGSDLFYSSSISYLPGLAHESVMPSGKKSRILATGGINKVVAAGTGSVTSKLLNDNLVFTDSLYYDPTNVADDFVGIADPTIGFWSATKFTVPEGENFALSHVRNFYRTETSEDPITLRVYRGGTTPTEGSLLLTQSYSVLSAEGSFELIELDEFQSFMSGETFWVVFEYPLSMVFAQGVNENIAGIDGVFFYTIDDGASWVPLENDLPLTAFKVRALSNTLVDSGWITLNPDQGEVRPGNTAAMDVLLDASELDAGEYFAQINFESNDPFSPSQSVPVKLSVNALPEFFLTPGDTLEIYEMQELEVVLKANDADGEILLYTLDEVYANASFDAYSDSAVVSFQPDYTQSGYYSFTVAALDDMLERGDYSFVVKVMDVNRIPAVVRQIPKQVYRAQQSTNVLDLSAYIQDPDLDELEFSVNAGNSNLLTLSTQGKLLFIDPLEVGQTFVSVIADDGKGGLAGTSFEVMIEAANTAPVVSKAIENEDLIVSGDMFTLDLSHIFNDPDDDKLYYLAASSDESIASVAVEENTLIVNQTGIGEVSFTIQAFDGKGGEALTNFDTRIDRVTGIGELLGGEEFSLFNYPNPFVLTTTISYNITEFSDVKLEVLTSDGKSVKVLVEEKQHAGEYKVVFDRNAAAAGTYLYKISVNGKVKTMRMAIE